MRYSRKKTIQTKLTYPQDWFAYNQAQTKEKILFMDLLSSITEFIKHAKIKSRGRPTIGFKDAIFCIGMMTYCAKSSRRTISELKIAKEMGYIQKVPHFNTVLGYLKKPGLAVELQKLIQLSSTPLRNVETNFAIDSTGFSTTRYRRWYDHKWGDKHSKQGWVKAHFMIGTKTHIVTSVTVTHGTAADSPQLKPLLDKTTETFTIQEVSADKAYSSRKNLEAIHDAGGVPYIPFKENTKPRSRGHGIWNKMWWIFFRQQENFLEHYHQRSNVESMISMMKRKLTDKLRGTSLASQSNEIYCMTLVHNLIVIIHEMYELGIDTDFCATKTSAQKNTH